MLLKFCKAPHCYKNVHLGRRHLDSDDDINLQKSELEKRTIKKRTSVVPKHKYSPNYELKRILREYIDETNNKIQKNAVAAANRNDSAVAFPNKSKSAVAYPNKSNSAVAFPSKSNSAAVAFTNKSDSAVAFSNESESSLSSSDSEDDYNYMDMGKEPNRISTSFFPKFSLNRMGLKCLPMINGKEVDLDLLYQIVTSHGGWEKVNARNEWDDLLEHFHLPRGTNGGLVIKQIYLKYLETYEKIYFLGEDVENKEGFEDDFDDNRHRRRHTNKVSSRSYSNIPGTASQQPSHQQLPVPLSESMREQLGLSTQLVASTDYDRLLLSLQSPLPNDQDLAISVCTLLSNETKHVLKFSKCPAILNMLLAHSGIYQHCGLRMLMEDTYSEARGMNLTKFWEDIVDHKDTRPLLCECYVDKVQTSLGLTEGEEDEGDDDISSDVLNCAAASVAMDIDDDKINSVVSVPESVSSLQEPGSTELSKDAADSPDSLIVEKDAGTAVLNLEISKENEESEESGVVLEKEKESELDIKPIIIIKNDPPIDSIIPTLPESLRQELFPSSPDLEPETTACCSACPCKKRGKEFDEVLVPIISDCFDRKNLDDMEQEEEDLPFCLIRSAGSDDKVGLRIQQVAHILRNLSFEDDNASVMASNPTLLRYLLITANCSWGTLPQMSYDLLGNIAGHITLQDPLKDPISSMLLTLVSSGLFSPDRFKVLRSLEVLRDLTKTGRNETIITRYLEKGVYKRMCELLTVCDIMLLIYTLECILSMTGLGEAVCNELVRVKGSVATLVSLVTVEAQSYGPKGCILMRVVETLSGGSQSSQTPAAIANNTTVAAPQTSPASATSGQSQTLQQHLQSSTPSSMMANSIPIIGLRTVTGHTVVPPSQPQQGIQGLSMTQQSVTTNQSSSGIGGGNLMNINTPLQQQQLRTVLRPNLTPNCGTTISAPPLQSIQVVQVSRPNNSISPSLPLLNRSLSPGPILTPISQVPTKVSSGNSLPVMVNHLNTNPITVSSASSLMSHGSHNSTVVMSQMTGSSNSVINNVNHAQVNSVTASVCATTGAGATPVVGGLAQVSSQSLTQQVYTPSLNLVSPKGVAGEENWLMAWLNGGFETGGGSSIEQGKFYMMYSCARKDDGAVLPMEKFIQCVKNVYGASVGPVMKTFGSTTLSFIEGIKPKITLHVPPVSNAVSVASPRISIPVTTTSTNLINLPHNAVVNNSDAQSSPQVMAASNGITAINNQANASTASAVVRPTTPVQSPVSVLSSSPLSPILKATLSRPPTPKSPPGEKRGRAVKVKDKKCAIKQSTNKKKNLKGSQEVHRIVGKQQATAKVLSPSSSAIRSLLASKVAQRQQKKLQQQQTKNQKSKNNSVTGEKPVGKGKKKLVKMNGAVDSTSEKGEESSASSSINSIEESDGKTDYNTPTFQGVLCNGTSSAESLKEQPMELGTDVVDESRHNSNSLTKGMLVDLLERKVLPRDPVNGLLGREIRISEKGLEIIESLKQDSNSAASGTLLNNALGVNDSQEPQQMTFYASTPDVVPSGQIQNSYNSELSIPSGTVLLSGGGTLKTQQAQVKPEEVNACNVQSEGLVMSSENETMSYGAGGDGNSIANCEMGSNGGSNSNGGGGGGDLLEKFSQFSDLIVVNPEQLGLKRPAPSTPNSDGSTESSMQETPPTKKLAFCVNGSDVPSSVAPTVSSAIPAISASNMCPITSSSVNPSVLHTALSIAPTSPTVQSNLVANSSSPSISSPEAGKVTVTATTNNNQMMHLPVRLSVNPQNPQQLTFSTRQLVLPAGQQFLLSTNNSQTGMTGLQGQVIISKSTGSSNDIQRAIILLHPNHQQSQQQSQQAAQQQQQTQASHTLPLTQGQIQTTMSTPSQVQLGFSLAARREGIPPNVCSQIPNEQLEQELPFLCEWTGCGFRFSKYQQVFMHAIKAHVPESTEVPVACNWGINGCDPHLRKRFSIMTHLQDRHCSKQALELALYRRKNKIEPPPAPPQTVNHPGYAPNAALQAIKRHALQYMNPKEIVDENEGPVTKSIRLTSALILRNVVNYSRVGRRMIGSYESHLSSIAMSNVESSRTIAQMLHDMSEGESS